MKIGIKTLLQSEACGAVALAILAATSATYKLAELAEIYISTFYIRKHEML